MTKEHSHAQVLRWIADGKELQALYGQGCWQSVTGDDALNQIVRNTNRAPEHFRLAPRTIKVGSREINAPLREAPAKGRRYWIVTSRADILNDEWTNHQTDRDRLACGNVWATEADATAARDAWRDLMMGGE